MQQIKGYSTPTSTKDVRRVQILHSPLDPTYQNLYTHPSEPNQSPIQLWYIFFYSCYYFYIFLMVVVREKKGDDRMMRDNFRGRKDRHLLRRHLKGRWEMGRWRLTMMTMMTN